LYSLQPEERIKKVFLFPLYGTGRFRRDIIGNPVDTPDFIDDPTGNAAEQGIGKF
jgi:hypothetical protein